MAMVTANYNFVFSENLPDLYWPSRLQIIATVSVSG